MLDVIRNHLDLSGQAKHLVYGKNDDPSEVQLRRTGLDQLSEHASAMLKGSQRQTYSEEKQAA
ncbi:TPA: hypothetical protein ACTYNU_002067 [Enterobacter hormaechei]|uniref:Uncharacterized protein n=1 Tax=Enterobacter hormaechei TaxID=158836 RepID=A0A2J0Q239_9ENTR|nr:hypothetical protein [Enterobacter hormaechei]KAF6704296.1 hypothetical protein G9393_11025 [Enterobacter hormaechei]KAF6712574.1 hypothetical protein G9387_10535 [Enterobacter hormaechei]KLQ76922.1 hypothetical protein ABF63_23535 [Enterobacter hormaechei subsp. steigerwaltii]KZQ02316.1 hypothetical protein A3N35_17815 [Enterobacter hormaechei subsp. steigerwaltii]PJD86664.1 hypothetical protein B9Q30_12380 [Enterobacter hormaechei]